MGCSGTVLLLLSKCRSCFLTAKEVNKQLRQKHAAFKICKLCFSLLLITLWDATLDTYWKYATIYSNTILRSVWATTLLLLLYICLLLSFKCMSHMFITLLCFFVCSSCHKTINWNWYNAISTPQWQQACWKICVLHYTFFLKERSPLYERMIRTF
jgi:hypothetical protein